MMYVNLLQGRKLTRIALRTTLICLMGLLFSASQLSAQTITGTLSDSDSGEPLSGATIIEKGTKNGTLSDADGRYSISVSNPDAVLIFSFIGYNSQEVSVTGKNFS